MTLARLALLPISLVFLLGCPPQRDCDADRDGYDALRCGGDDCNDRTYLAAPGQAEICDGLDNDCDGDIDSPPPASPPTWYADADGDGYGDPEETVGACSVPDGYVNNGMDCDDTRTLVRPGGTETCDGVDNDCDGEIDEDDAEFAPDWWRDADGDGYGDVTRMVTACDAPDGYVDNRTDCDDDASDVHPGADDPCDDRDSDCDGIVETLWYADADGDGFGDAAAVLDDCDPGDGWALVPDDCDDDNADVYPEAAEICGDGVENSCDGIAPGCGIAGDVDVPAAAANTIVGAAPAVLVGDSLAVGDLDDDGQLDVVVGEAGVSPSPVWMFSDLLAAGPTTEEADAVVTDPGWTFGRSVTSGDVTGDGIDDLLVGDPDGGAVYLFAGPLSGAPSSADADIIGEGFGGEFGGALAFADDLDGDGFADVVIGARFGSNEGRVYLFRGGPGLTSLDAETADGVLVGDTNWAEFGASVTGLGDVDGDGLGDIAVGQPNSSWGRVHIFSGLPEGTVPLSEAWATIAGVNDNQFVGASVTALGDIDADGLGELGIAGMTWVDGDRFAAGWVVDPTAGFSDVRDATTALLGDEADPNFGVRVRIDSLGDLDGDGAPALGLSWLAASGGVSAAIFDGPFHGPDLDLAAAEARLIGIAGVGEYLSLPTMASVGDLDGDGYGELVVGNPSHSTEEGQFVGGLHVVLGGPGL